MIHGALKWDDRNTFYTQDNNPTEEQLRKHGIKSYLETCGPTAAVNCLSAMGKNTDLDNLPGEVIQPEEALSDFLNDPKNYDALRNERPDLNPAGIPGNRVPQYYPYAIKKLFNVTCDFRWSLTFDDIAKSVKNKRAIQICFRNPGHYVGVVAYDDVVDELIYRDPWPGNPMNKNGGFNERLKRSKFSNVQNYFLIYN